MKKFRKTILKEAKDIRRVATKLHAECVLRIPESYETIVGPVLSVWSVDGVWMAGDTMEETLKSSSHVLEV